MSSDAGKKLKLSLSEAAAELVRAAEMEVDGATQRKLVTSLEALKESFDAKLNTIQQVVKQASSNSDDKIDTVNQNIDKLNETMKNDRKMQSLEWAIQNADVNCFDYYVPNANSCYHTKTTSTVLIRNTLLWFRRGRGYYLDDGNIHDQDPAYLREQQKDEAKEKFRTKFVAQIYALTGVEPRLEKQTDGRYIIYYS